MSATLYVGNDEWYPVWSAVPNDPVGDPIEVDAETAKRWVRVFTEFDAVQKEIRAAAYAAGHYGPPPNLSTSEGGTDG